MGVTIFGLCPTLIVQYLHHDRCLRLGCHLYTWLAQTYTGWCNRDYTLSVYKRLHLLLLALDGKVSLGCKNKGNSQLMIIFGMAKANTNNGWPNNVVLVD